MDPELSVIIPVYNEEKNIVPLYQELKEVLLTINITHELIFIDDGSNDASYALLCEIHHRDPLVKIIKFRRNFGQSAAMKAGFENAKGQIIITMDADLQNDPNDIPALLAKISDEDYDVICGWRHTRHDSFSKRINSKISNKFRTFLTGERIHDSGCTLRAYTRDSVKDIELYGELHRYIPTLLFWKGYRIGEIETHHRERKYGKTKYNWQRLAKGFLDLLVVTFWQRYSARPMHIFGGLGLLFGGLGLIISLYLGISRLILGTGLTDRPLFLVGLVLLIVGVQFIGLGIIADILLKIYHGQKEKKTYLIEKVVE